MINYKHLHYFWAVAQEGGIDQVKEQFYAISVERRIHHPVISAIMEQVRETLFANK